MSGAEGFRLEHDSMGEVRVPQNALYGAQTARAVENFQISGLRPYRAFIWSMATVKRAAAEVNAALGLLDPTAAEAIARAAEEVRAGQWDDQFVVDPFQAGAGTSHNMNANEVVANRATQLLGGRLGEYRVHPNDHVNMAQSTNDTIPTAIRLGCLWRLDELLEAVGDLALGLQRKAEAFDPIVKSGRTHLQDAVPIRLGQEFGGYATAVARDGDRIRRSAEGLRRLGIGGTAVGTGLNAHPEYHARMVRRLSELAGRELQTCDNLFEAMQSMADMADFSASLRTLAITLTRIANDFRLLASGPATGLDELRLPAVQPGSSIMPGKVNPVQAEMLNMAMFHVIGCDTTVALGAQAGQLELNVMMPVIAHNALFAMIILTNATREFDRACVRGIEPDERQCAYWLERSPALVTALAPKIGYAEAARLAKEAVATGLTVKELVMQRGILDGKELEEVLDLRAMTELGIPGGKGAPTGG
ncbi:MAG TPA: aspartate ammonia-lyase [Gemmatimonadales bacterium]